MRSVEGHDYLFYSFLTEFTAVSVERYGIRFGFPARIKRYVRRYCRIYFRYFFRSALFLVPAQKFISRFSRGLKNYFFVLYGVACGIFSVASSAQHIRYPVFVQLPTRVQLVILRIAYRRPLGYHASAVCCRKPAFKRIALPFGYGQLTVCLFVSYRDFFSIFSRIQGDGIRLCLPARVKKHRPVIFSRQIDYLSPIVVNLFTVFRLCPAGKSVSGARKAVCRQFRRNIVG